MGKIITRAFRYSETNVDLKYRSRNFKGALGY